MSVLSDTLESFRKASHTEREKGIYFENLARVYFQNEPRYKDLYSDVWLWEAWRAEWIKAGNKDPGTDTGIDLVAKTHGTNEYHAIQAKFYDSDSTVYKKQVDSFFTASGKKPFTHRLLILSTDKISPHVDTAMEGQHIPCQKVTLSDLADSKIDWASWFAQKAVHLKERKEPRPYQKTAIADVVEGLSHADRGKLIMACGTGKTFTSLRLAEQVAGAGGRVLFLVPSLSLLSQTLTEWTQETATPMHSFAVCSDSEVGKGRDKDDDYQMLVHELQYPATTNPKMLANEVTKRHDAQHMSVVFSTYHSIEVISQAQKLYGLADFDLIVCDEAHRTTGAKFDGDEEAAFVKVHNQDIIRGSKRVYMTATPRVYGVPAKTKAETESIVLYSMDNAEFFGETLHTLSFSEAVHGLNILCDYKVVVLTISEDHISKHLQKSLADENNSLRVDDAAKIVGCWRALSKQDTQDDLSHDPDPMRRAVAFCQVIDIKKGAKTHKVSSKNIASMFKAVVDEYRAELLKENPDDQDLISKLVCEAEHVDGGMNAAQKGAKLDWLKADIPDDTCRVLSNVRCLSEGVDVPALDAVLFLTPRNSQVDVVQSVGRVMRKPKDGKKKLGYVILPVVIPSGMEPNEALNDNKTYKVVWEVLQALRSHDDRFDAMINKLDLTGQDKSKMEIIAITDSINVKVKPKGNVGDANVAKVKKAVKQAKGGQNLGTVVPDTTAIPTQQSIEYHVGDIERAIVAKVVQKCGNRLYWSEWASNIASIAQTNISRITAILDKPENTAEIAAFSSFLKELKDDLNDGITRDEAIEMLAQHIITKPVFEALFEGYSFTSHNPVSIAMQGVLERLDKHSLDKEALSLERFYENVRMQAAGITDLNSKQKIIIELYDKFFSSAFPRLRDKLGIVYTPIEVVDFIIHSVNDVLKSEFNQTLGSKGVHIIDPFTGTGTFITRLLQSGLIGKTELAYKFQSEIHANEIVLLAYYIAAVNIEQVYHAIMGDGYVPFGGICLTDTFALYEPSSHAIGTDALADNSSRRRKQKKLDIRVIVGNPPYSVGQASANDNNANTDYPVLDEKIKSTYARFSKATSVTDLRNSYIRAIRWASDRIGNSGVIGFVSGSGFLDKPTMDGMRKCLNDEFSSIYILNLRGDIRKNMLSKGAAKEGQNVFQSGSMTGIAISILVKNSTGSAPGQIFYCDIGDDLRTDEKLQKLAGLSSVGRMRASNHWLPLSPDQHNDWLNQRDDSLGRYPSMGDKRDAQAMALFRNFSLGLATGRDHWVYNFSANQLLANMQRMIAFFNSEVKRYKASCQGLIKDDYPEVDDFINADPTKISWNRNLKIDISRHLERPYQADVVTTVLYRPFSKSHVYFSKHFTAMMYQLPRLFPDSSVRNRVICVSGKGSRNGFSVLMSDCLPDLNILEAGAQSFPLYLFEKRFLEEGINDESDAAQDDFFGASSSQTQSNVRASANGDYLISDAISDVGLAYFTDAYKCADIGKEDLFYYVYGLLHSEDYKRRFADNLSKELPRIPAVKKFIDFQGFSAAGRRLADLHINYETVAPYQVEIEGGSLLMADFTDSDYSVTQMKFASKADKTRVVYNHKITMSGIPLDAYEYVVNGKSALEWVMERQAVTTHKDSGIVNDANLWATETMGDAAYPLKLFQRVITVSLETMKIVRALPRLDI